MTLFYPFALDLDIKSLTIILIVKVFAMLVFLLVFLKEDKVWASLISVIAISFLFTYFNLNWWLTFYEVTALYIIIDYFNEKYSNRS